MNTNIFTSNKDHLHSRCCFKQGRFFANPVFQWRPERDGTSSNQRKCRNDDPWRLTWNLNSPQLKRTIIFQTSWKGSHIHRIPLGTFELITSKVHLEDHPRTCKWLGSPPFISGLLPFGRGPTTRSWKETKPITMDIIHLIAGDDPPSTDWFIRILILGIKLIPHLWTIWLLTTEPSTTWKSQEASKRLVSRL